MLARETRPAVEPRAPSWQRDRIDHRSFLNFQRIERLRRHRQSPSIGDARNLNRAKTARQVPVSDQVALAGLTRCPRAAYRAIAFELAHRSELRNRCAV